MGGKLFGDRDSKIFRALSRLGKPNTARFGFGEVKKAAAVQRDGGLGRHAPRRISRLPTTTPRPARRCCRRGDS